MERSAANRPATAGPGAWRVTLAQIRFAPPEAHDEVTPATPRIATDLAPAAPAAPPPRAKDNEAIQPKIVRVFVALDANGKILSARAAEENPSPETSLLIARLHGAAIERAALPSTGAPQGEILVEIDLSPASVP
jgi:hypothetical protein